MHLPEAKNFASEVVFHKAIAYLPETALDNAFSVSIGAQCVAMNTEERASLPDGVAPVKGLLRFYSCHLPMVIYISNCDNADEREMRMSFRGGGKEFLNRNTEFR